MTDEETLWRAGVDALVARICQGAVMTHDQNIASLLGNALRGLVT